MAGTAAEAEIEEGSLVLLALLDGWYWRGCLEGWKHFRRWKAWSSVLVMVVVSWP